MATHIPFIRYLVIAMPLLAVILSESTWFLLATRNAWKRITPAILILLILVLNAAVLPSINTYKPARALGDDKWSYLKQVFEEGEAWNWINENTSKDARIATYDIKEYYIERDTLQLDGNESAPLYKPGVTIEQCMDFLHEKGVTHILSVPWASPNDTRLPPAYKNCSILTGYLGDTRYFPPIYVGSYGTTVYNVGSMDEIAITESFNLQGFAPPIKHVTINLTHSSNSSFRIPIPVDYREGLMSVNSSQPTNVTLLWNGLVPAEKMPLNPSNSSLVYNESFEWQEIDKAGYFTLIVDANQISSKSFVNLDIRFYNYWDLKRL